MPLTPHQAQYIAHDLTLQHAGAGPAAWLQSQSQIVKAKPEQAYANHQPEIHQGARDAFREIARLFVASFERHSAILKTTKETGVTGLETTKETSLTGLETGPEIGVTGLEPPENTKKTPRKQPENTKKTLLVMLQQQPDASIRALAEQSGLSQASVRHHLRSMQADNMLRRVGPDKGGYWEVISDSVNNSPSEAQGKV